MYKHLQTSKKKQTGVLNINASWNFPVVQIGSGLPNVVLLHLIKRDFCSGGKEKWRSTLALVLTLKCHFKTLGSVFAPERSLNTNWAGFCFTEET